MDDLGHVDKIIVSKDSSVLIKEAATLTDATLDRINELKEQQKNQTIKEDRDFINERIASLAGAIGCIYVGGNSDVEQKEKFDRVDDAVCAVRSALQEGIVAGGGIALYKIATYIEDDNFKVAGKMLARALRAPLEQIYTNAGLEISEDTKQKLMYDQGYEGLNIKSGEWGDMYKMGVIDPLKVTKNALINAVSVATTILSTNAIVTHARA
jgi:chaperonin GroEL